MSESIEKAIPTPPVVALIGWLIPGAGYWTIGQRGRGLTVGVTIVLLFVAGLFIGGVRALEVPGYGEHGERVAYPIVQNNTVVGSGWILTTAPLTEIRNKPWSVPQIMAGPIAVVAGAFSVWAAGPQHVSAAPTFGDDAVQTAPPRRSIGELTYSRMNEIPSLYLSVAGLLNLLVIIDATWRASVILEGRRERAVAA